MAGHVLDNPVWHALNGPRRSLGTVRGGAARFDNAVSPFAAVVDDSTPPDWADLRELVRPGRAAVLIEPAEPPEDWSVEARIPSVQLVAPRPFEPVDLPFVELGPGDAAEMLSLIERTRPGPFSSRTVEMGGYLGLREEGELIAMAGERLSCGGFTEISAVCTIAERRGRGLASALTRTVGSRIQARGDTPFLHAAATNEVAIRLYYALGFELRRRLDFVVVRAPV